MNPEVLVVKSLVKMDMWLKSSCLSLPNVRANVTRFQIKLDDIALRTQNTFCITFELLVLLTALPHCFTADANELCVMLSRIQIHFWQRCSVFISMQNRLMKTMQRCKKNSLPKVFIMSVLCNGYINNLVLVVVLFPMNHYNKNHYRHVKG